MISDSFSNSHAQKVLPVMLCTAQNRRHMMWSNEACRYDAKLGISTNQKMTIRELLSMYDLRAYHTGKE